MNGLKNLVNLYNGLLCSLRKERNPTTWYNKDGFEDIIMNEISQAQKDKYSMDSAMKYLKVMTFGLKVWLKG
jgi:hypothetical protein